MRSTTLLVIALCAMAATAEAQPWRRCYNTPDGYVCSPSNGEPPPYLTPMPYSMPRQWGEGPNVREEWRRPQFWNWRPQRRTIRPYYPPR